MKSNDLESKSIDELWSLHELVTSTLACKMAAEKEKLEDRLRSIEEATSLISGARRRRPYPKVLPKYQNPNDPAELWSGRGRRPHWVQAQLKAGKKIEHFLIARSSIERHRRAGR
jgi:DNA-binding protein H-NS